MVYGTALAERDQDHGLPCAGVANCTSSGDSNCPIKCSRRTNLTATRDGRQREIERKGTAMLTTADSNALLQSVRAELTNVILCLQAHQGRPEPEIEKAVAHLEQALLEVDRALADTVPAVTAKSEEE